MSITPQNLTERLKAAGKDLEQSVSQAAEAVGSNFKASANISVGGVASAVEGAISQITGATVDMANSVNGITGPALGALDLAQGGLSNALQRGVGSLVSGFTSGLGNGIGGLLGGIFGGLAGKQPNVLENFASYNYKFTLGCLTDFELNFPDFTYRIRDPLITILKDGGGNTRGSRTIYERNGKTEYFIDDVEIETIVAGNAGTRSTNATSLNFKITEPYSMGLFLQALQIAALSAGHKNYIEAPYVLVCEFVGYDQSGRPYNARNARRIFPLKFVNVEFDVTEGGSVYAVQAIPFHEEALTDQVQSTPTDTSFKGSTVAEMLQTGVQSLATILNNNELQKVAAKQKPVADQYVIMFPKSLSSAEEAAEFAKASGDGSQNSATTQGNGSQGDSPFEYREFTEEELQRLYDSSTGILNGDVPADFDAEIKKVLGIAVKRSDLGESIREYAEKEENMNDIGKAKIVKSRLDSGRQAMGKAGQCESETTPGEIDRCRVQRSDDVRQMTFSAGKKIQDMIEEVILVSEFGRGITERKPDQNGMVDWFRTETNLYQVTDSKNVDQTGKPARIYVFRVVPYKVHHSKFRAPTEKSKGIQQLKYQAVKEYNYIYTGKNKDIINFDIKFNHAFFTAIAGDFGQKTADSLNSATGEVSAGNTRAVPGLADGGTEDVNATKAGHNVTRGNVSDGGGVVIHPETQVARSFNEALVNSPADLIAVELTIWGDPYYITDSGMGNYSALQLPGSININADGTMDYQSGEVDIEINFRTPIDYKGNWMEFPGGGFAPVGQFSGLYQVLFCKNSFSKGQFTQTLQTIRRPKQESDTATTAVDRTGAITTDNPEKQLVSTNTNPIGGNASSSTGGTGGQASYGASSEGNAGEAEARANTRSASGAGDEAAAQNAIARRQEATRINNVQAARANGANVGY